MNSATWDIFVPQTQKGMYNKYSNQLVVILSVTHDKRDNIKSARLYLTSEADKKLAHPEFSMIGVSGSNVGIIPISTNSEGKAYSVTRKHEKNDKQVGMPFINVTAFAKAQRLRPGVYSAWMDNGVLCFNMMSAPSKP